MQTSSPKTKRIGTKRVPAASNNAQAAAEANRQPRPRSNRKNDSAAASPNSRLILVECADPGRLDLVLEAVRRRLEHLQPLAFVTTVSTRQLPAGGGIAMTRSRFRSMESAGQLALAWCSGGTSYGHCSSFLDRLGAGETVVAGASSDIAADARRQWGNVRLVRLTTSTDRARSPLTPRACLTRLTDTAGAPRVALKRLLSERLDATVLDDGDFARTVIALSVAIAGLLPAGVRAAKRRRLGRRRRTSASRMAAATSALASAQHTGSGASR